MRAVRAAGGEVHTDVPIRGILCEADEAEGKVRAIGVRLGGAALSRAGSRDSVAAVACDDGEDDDADPSLSTVRCGHSVVSGVGALCTYTRLLPPEAVSDAARKALALLVEARPRVAVVFWLKGGLAELGLASTDYVEIPAQVSDCCVASEPCLLSVRGTHLISPCLLGAVCVGVFCVFAVGGHERQRRVGSRGVGGSSGASEPFLSPPTALPHPTPDPSSLSPLSLSLTPGAP